MRIRKTLSVSVEEARQLEEFCKDADNLWPVGPEELLFDKEVVFPDGRRFAVQVCASSEQGETAWTQVF